MKFDDQLFLSGRGLRKLVRKRHLKHMPRWPDGPLDPIPGGGTLEVQLRDGRIGIMPITYDAVQQRAKASMAKHDRLNYTSAKRLMYQLSLDRYYKRIGK